MLQTIKNFFNEERLVIQNFFNTKPTIQQPIIRSLLGKQDGSLQEFFRNKCFIECNVNEHNQVIKAVLRQEFVQPFINLRDSLNNSNGNKRCIKNAISAFNKEFLKFLDYSSYQPSNSKQQKPSFEDALPQMFQDLTLRKVIYEYFNNNLLSTGKEMIDVLHTSSKNLPSECVFYIQSKDDKSQRLCALEFTKSINQIVFFIKEDIDSLSWHFHTIILHLIQPICNILKNQEWAKNLIEDKQQITELQTFKKNYAQFIQETYGACEKNPERLK